MQWPLHAVYVQYTQYSAIATIVISQLVDCVSAQKYSIPKAMARTLMTSIFVTLACNYIHNSNACVWSWSSRKEVHIYIYTKEINILFSRAGIAVLAAEASAEKPVAKAEQACKLVCPPCYKLVANPDGSCACEVDQTINCICKIDPNCSCPPGLQGTRCNGNNGCVCAEK